LETQNDRIQIIYLEHIPEKKWLGTWEYEDPYTFASNLRTLPKINATYWVPKVVEYNSNPCGICIPVVLSPTSVCQLSAIGFELFCKDIGKRY
jgi:hypothetical protein